MNGFTITTVKQRKSAQFPKGAYFGHIDGHCCTPPLADQLAAKEAALDFLHNGYLASLVARLETYLAWLADDLNPQHEEEALSQVAELYPSVQKAMAFPAMAQQWPWSNCRDLLDRAEEALEDSYAQRPAA